VNEGEKRRMREAQLSDDIERDRKLIEVEWCYEEEIDMQE
jgi:hypothetical protein